MTERTIVARRWDMIPPPGSSARFSCTLESTTLISPRVVTAPPGPSLPPRVSVTLRSSMKPVPSDRNSRFSKQVCRSVWPCPSRSNGTRRLAERVAQLARSEGDVRLDVDCGHAWVAPRSPQLRLVVDRDRLLGKQRVAVADPAGSMAAQDPALVEAAQLVRAPLGAGVAADPAPEEAVAHPAAAEEGWPDAALLHAPVATGLAAGCAVQAALVVAHDARAAAAARTDHPHPEHGAGARAPCLAEPAVSRVRGPVRPILALTYLSDRPKDPEVPRSAELGVSSPPATAFAGAPNAQTARKQSVSPRRPKTWANTDRMRTACAPRPSPRAREHPGGTPWSIPGRPQRRARSLLPPQRGTAGDPSGKLAPSPCRTRVFTGATAACAGANSGPCALLLRRPPTDPRHDRRRDSADIRQGVP